MDLPNDAVAWHSRRSYDTEGMTEVSGGIAIGKKTQAKKAAAESVGVANAAKAGTGELDEIDWRTFGS
jgi:hypothetical protein